MSAKQVIVFRRDLNCRKGKLAAQVSHASLKVFLDQRQPSDASVLTVPLWASAQEWINGIFTKIVVGCEDETALLTLEIKAKSLGLMTALVTDSGLTEFHGVPTTTCLAIGPNESELIDQVTGHLKPL